MVRLRVWMSKHKYSQEILRLRHFITNRSSCQTKSMMALATRFAAPWKGATGYAAPRRREMSENVTHTRGIDGRYPLWAAVEVQRKNRIRRIRGDKRCGRHSLHIRPGWVLIVGRAPQEGHAHPNPQYVREHRAAAESRQLPHQPRDQDSHLRHRYGTCAGGLRRSDGGPSTVGRGTDIGHDRGQQTGVT
ncbi:hypothetical protein DE4587_02295 [Mycobacteroides salmoniphilum]|nr:hypothetical protein DE4586_02991 [Mycobacteroides salmoniphilum]TDZ86908.1 hypothetical protein DE4587_02295 [Mycobacteroides salmoniphilum]